MAAELGQLLLQESRAVGATEAVDCASKGWVRPGRRPGVRVSQELARSQAFRAGSIGLKERDPSSATCPLCDPGQVT